jgi:hypothetical protein
MPFRFYPESLADHFSPRLLPLLLTLSVMLPDLASAADEEKRDQQKTENLPTKYKVLKCPAPALPASGAMIRRQKLLSGVTSCCNSVIPPSLM